MQSVIDLEKIKSGIYILEIKAEKSFNLSPKKFNNILFQKGFYYYVGSAQKNLDHRVLRHIKKEKTIHWHIDNITTLPEIKITSVYIFENKPKSFETDLVLELEKHFKLNYAARGFGNSDDPVCESHLLFSKKKISYNHFISRYQSTVRFIPSSMEIF